jgi:hypothetical protein
VFVRLARATGNGRCTLVLWTSKEGRLPADPVIDAYKANVDRTLLRERLKRTPAERVEDLVALARFAEELARRPCGPRDAMTDFAALLRILAEAGVEYILVGGVAAVAQSPSRLTRDVDVVSARSPENVARLARARPVRPLSSRRASWPPVHMERGDDRPRLNFTLTTTLGELDLLGIIVGGGTYVDLRAHAIAVDGKGRGGMERTARIRLKDGRVAPCRVALV